MARVGCINSGHLIGALQFRDRALRQQDGVVARFDLRAHLAVLAGTQEITGVREKARDLERASVDINLAAGKEPFARSWDKSNRPTESVAIAFPIDTHPVPSALVNCR